MNAFLVALLILIILFCLIIIALQLRATYARANRKTKILRSVVAGFAMNLGLLLIAILKNALISHSPFPVQASLPEEIPILALQGLLTLVFFGIFEFRNKIRRHLSEFNREYGEK